MKKIAATILILICALSAFACADDYSDSYYENEKIVFEGSAITLWAKMWGSGSPSAYNKMLERLKDLDKEISLTRDDSVLTSFNNSTDTSKSFKISRDVYDMITLAIEYENDTNGAFNIAVYPLSELWHLTVDGYSGFSPSSGEPLSFTLPSIQKVEETLAYCDTGLLELTENTETGEYFLSKSDPRVKIDLGAIAKGYCADLCYDIMNEYNIVSGVVSLSGNIVVKGGYYDGKNFSKWEMGISSPRPRYIWFGKRDDLCAVSISADVSIVTSGDYERYYLHSSGIIPCHIVNPISGLPAGIEHIPGTENEYKMQSSAVSSATIFCSRSSKADAYSTAAFVMGLEGAYEFFKDSDSVQLVIFSENYINNETSHGKMAVVGDVEFYRTDYFNGFKSYILYTGQE